MSLAYCFTAYGGPDVQRFLDVTVPAPGRGEVLVRVHAAGVNPVDWKVRAGMHRSFLPLVLPAVLGREVAGVVVRTGPEVVDLAVGDRVFGATVGGSGGYAELALLPAGRSAPMPAGATFPDAAALPVAAATAHGSLARLDVAPGGTLLILGAGGGVGTMATQLAVLAGVTVVGTASAAKRAAVASLGATVVAYDEDDVEPRLGELLPAGADAVLDLVGGDALLGAAGVVTDRTRVLGVTGEPLATRFGADRLVNVGDSATLSALAELLGDGRLDPRVHRVFPFAAAGEALALVESGHAAGKVVIDVAGDR
ncbi:NADP-dependent oxidoreductase [Streptomyces hainanensis]|uniref:NADP-dependent oxidoreductase n=1 Tax=Streptomyces hainanensis TaxID=402648 RepID=A0A4V2Y4C9_9ACTN|nr:NADP-dependent oxidoreductase [Streptomyces hainanensis]TDC79825.1 NADP-dependent oxidoreductase [Streptomyces hainanensis]